MSYLVLPFYVYYFLLKSTFFILFAQVDPNNTGAIPAGAAACFLKKSGLSDIILGKVSIHIQQCYS